MVAAKYMYLNTEITKKKAKPTLGKDQLLFVDNTTHRGTKRLIKSREGGGTIVGKEV